MNIECCVYRCARQDEMYLYLRADLSIEQLPEALRRRAGRLTEVMRLQLHPQRRLARADVTAVLERLNSEGWYLQMPPQAQIQAHLHFGD